MTERLKSGSYKATDRAQGEKSYPEAVLLFFPGADGNEGEPCRVAMVGETVDLSCVPPAIAENWRKNGVIVDVGPNSTQVRPDEGRRFIVALLRMRNNGYGPRVVEDK